ncbi:hypothetical protein AB0O65_10920 [Microbacterium sp. NPDC077391]|uniref:5' nucleotidase, NT5C type n=1 Tax=Microbacterium sp. NPDC077391 TaxID=3154765 RepID=UPI003448FDF9
MSISLLIALDLDNTVADFTGGFAQWLKQQPEFKNRPLPHHSVYDLVESGWFTSHEEFIHYFHAAEEDGLYTSLSPYEGAVAVLREIASEHRHTFKAVTARREVFAEDTAEWLRRHGVPVTKVVHTEAKEFETADLFIDDAPSQIGKLFGQRELLVPTQLYNGHLAAGCHFAEWSDVPRRVSAVASRDRLPREYVAQLAA